MKKIIAILAVVIVVLSVALGVVLVKDSFEKTEYKAEIEEKINSEIDKLEADNPDGWRWAYAQFLERYVSEYGEEIGFERMCLGYVDDNDVPELFISEGADHASSVKVYTFENNIVTELCDTGSFGAVNYFEREGILCGYYMGMGVGSYWVYSIEDGKVQELYNAFTNEYFMGVDEGEYELEININGVDVASEELEGFLDVYFSKENSTWVFDGVYIDGEEDTSLFVDEGYGIADGEYKDYLSGFGK